MAKPRGGTDNARAKILYNQDDERLIAKTMRPFQRGYDCNLESGGEEYSKTRNKEILTDHF